MNVRKLPLEGMLLLEPKCFKDERGYFFESWRESDYQRIGIKERFVQDNLSYSEHNVLRGFHFQRDQGQLMTVAMGTVFDVVVDLRTTSSTYKQHFAIELTSDKPQQIYMPPGCAHGYVVISDGAVMHYKCTQYYDPNLEGGVIWNDPELSVLWPLDNPILSDKDKSYPTLREL